MGLLIARFTHPPDAERAAAVLRSHRFADVAVDTQTVAAGSALGLIELERDVQLSLALGLGICGALSLGMVGLLVGIAVGAPALSIWGVAGWCLGMALFGGIVGAAAGWMLAYASSLEPAADTSGDPPPIVERPIVVLPVGDRAEERAARAALRDTGVFEIALIRGERQRRPAHAGIDEEAVRALLAPVVEPQATPRRKGAISAPAPSEPR